MVQEKLMVTTHRMRLYSKVHRLQHRTLLLPSRQRPCRHTHRTPLQVQHKLPLIMIMLPPCHRCRRRPSSPLIWVASCTHSTILSRLYNNLHHLYTLHQDHSTLSVCLCLCLSTASSSGETGDEDIERRQVELWWYASVSL